MNRLTNDVEFLNKIIIAMENNFGIWKDILPSNLDELKKYFEELVEYKKLEQQGLLIKLPCKVGDTVFEICTHAGWSAMDIPTRYSIQERKFNYEYINDIGKTVFLTREEAEKALEVAND